METAAFRHYKQNRLQQLRGFVATVEGGSVTRAAEKLAMSQPSITLQIQALERELEVKLFERRGPKLVLTPDGQMLFELAQDLVHRMDTLPAAFEAKRGEVDRGRLDIAAGGSTILYLLPDFVKRFSDAYPRIELKLHNVTGRDGLQLLRAGQADIAVGSMIEEYPDIDFEALFSFESVLIAHRGHPLSERKRVTLVDIAKYDLILPPSHLTTWGVVEGVFRKHKLTPRVKMEVGSWEVIKEYVRRGMGISIVSSICMGDEDASSLWWCSVDRMFPQRTYGVVRRAGLPLSPQAQRFVELLQAGRTTGKPAGRA
jgi:LysR family transcriptional regulator, low CO2-responsive transcriptional regulator